MDREAQILSAIRQMQRDIAEMKELLANKVEEPINEDEAAKYLGLSKKTLQNYASRGTLIGTYEIDVLGRRMYYKSRFINRI